MKLVLQWRHKKFDLDHMLPKSLILVRRTASVIGDMRPLQFAHFWGFLFLFEQFLCE